MSWLCRVGLHRWTVIPEGVRELMSDFPKAAQRPDWYVGPRDRPYCERCGKRS